MLFSILIAVLVLLGVVLIALILLQQGKGADAGAAFGSGASGTVFGARGSATFLSRLTGTLMFCFMVLALVLAYVGRHGNVQGSSLMAGSSSSQASTTVAPESKRASQRNGSRSNKSSAPVTQKVPASQTGGK